MTETLADIYDRQDGYGVADPKWYEKMVHSIPPAPSVDRVKYCCERLKGKAVLSLGATGPMQQAVNSVAKECYGTDIEPADCDGFAGFWQIDLDHEPGALPELDVDIIFAGETFEHLANPGNVLAELRKYRCPLLATVPNAFAQGSQQYIVKGVECVNPDHVAWYSCLTFKTLLRRYDWRMTGFAWYNGPPMMAEGLIVEAEV